MKGKTKHNIQGLSSVRAASCPLSTKLLNIFIYRALLLFARDKLHLNSLYCVFHIVSFGLSNARSACVPAGMPGDPFSLS